MTTDNHDTLVYRLAQMLIKLNQGERLDPRALADEFGVTVRTVQRDLNERLAYLPMEKSGALYQLDPVFLGKLNSKDIDRFASLAGVRGLFPSLSDDFLRDIFDSRMQGSFLVKGHHFESLAGKEAMFHALEQAIADRHHISFDYNKPEGTKSYAQLSPYKLVNSKGIWYLLALEGERLKTFSFTKIAHLRKLEGRFLWRPEIERQVVENDSIWHSTEPKEVVLKIGSEVARYFKRRKLIANQVIEKELGDGGLILSAMTAHPNQILPIVRYWLPHIRIISPEDLQAELEQGMVDYMKRVGESRGSTSI